MIYNNTKKISTKKTYRIITKSPIYDTKKDNQITSEISKISQLYCLNSENKILCGCGCFNNKIKNHNFKDIFKKNK